MSNIDYPVFPGLNEYLAHPVKRHMLIRYYINTFACFLPALFVVAGFVFLLLL